MASILTPALQGLANAHSTNYNLSKTIILMFKRLSALLAFLVIGGIAADAQAQALKVGYTDHEVIIVNMPDYQNVQEQLQSVYQGSQQELQTLYQNYQEQLERYQRQQSLLSEERRQEREQELMQLQMDIQQQAQQKDQELAQREAELMKPILERVQAAIDQVATEKGLDLVLRSQVGAQPILLYVNENTIDDITLDVARNLGLDVSEAEASSASSGSN